MHGNPNDGHLSKTIRKYNYEHGYTKLHLDLYFKSYNLLCFVI